MTCAPKSSTRSPREETIVELPADAAGERRTLRIPLGGDRVIVRYVRGVGDRMWSVELDLDLPDVDPQEVLLGCEGYLVDSPDGEAIGVVDRVEASHDADVTALYVAAGWFGRRRFRVDARAIESLLPAARRIVVDDSRVTAISEDR